MDVQKERNIDSEGSNSEQYLPSMTDSPDWVLVEEKRARRKIDFTVLPLLFLGLLVFQLDRMNIASALTGGFAEDIKVSQATINLGNQLLFMGIVVLEIPCNMALQRIGPRIWIAAQVLVFGLLAIMQVFVQNRGAFLALRLLLGFAEAGYIPGAVYTLSAWYTKREMAKRVAIFFFGLFGGNALSPILASGILILDGRGGIRGWKWLFLVEGLFTVLISFLMALFLPASPYLARPLLSPGLIKFSDREKDILQKRLERENGESDGAYGVYIPWKVVVRTVSYYRRWPHFISTFVVFSTWSPLTTYSPSIIMSLGFSRTTANALTAVGASLSLVVVFMFAYLSDRFNRRGVIVISAHFCYLITLVVALTVQPHVGKWSRWGLWTAVNSFAVGYHPIQNLWVQLNCRDSGERSISIAMWVMSAISGLMVGTQYFQARDKPFYSAGLRTMIIMVCVGIASAFAQILIYVVHNKRVGQGKEQSKDGSAPFVHVL